MERYYRQDVLKNIGHDGQAMLASSRAAIVGVGSTGCASAELLARAGVGRLVVLDHDRVEFSNLNRQLLYDEDDVGLSKVEVAARKLGRINSSIEITPVRAHLVRDNTAFLESDVILDCTDNMDTRLVINDYALKMGIPWVYAGAVADRGMVYVTKPGRPCFGCMFKDVLDSDRCEDLGILNTASTMVASMQSTEALKVLLGVEPCPDLLHVNAWENTHRRVQVSRRDDCKSCNGEYEHLDGLEDYCVGFCRRKNAMSSKPRVSMKLDFEKLKEEFDVLKEMDHLVAMRVDGEEVVAYDYGELLFGTKNKDKANLIAEKVYGVGKTI